MTSKTKSKTLTKGDVIVEDIKIGDTLYEFEFGYCIKSNVVTLPTRNDGGIWSWQCKNVFEKGDKVINYTVSEEYPNYAPNIYTSEVYSGCRYI